MDAAVRTIAGSARSAGIEVEAAALSETAELEGLAPASENSEHEGAT